MIAAKLRWRDGSFSTHVADKTKIPFIGVSHADLLIAVMDEGATDSGRSIFARNFAEPTAGLNLSSVHQLRARHSQRRGDRPRLWTIFQQPSYLGKRVIRSTDIPSNALVVAASSSTDDDEGAAGLPGVESLDFFAFCKFSGLNLKPAALARATPRTTQEQELIPDRLRAARG